MLLKSLLFRIALSSDLSESPNRFLREHKGYNEYMIAALRALYGIIGHYTDRLKLEPRLKAALFILIII